MVANLKKQNKKTDGVGSLETVLFIYFFFLFYIYINHLFKSSNYLTILWEISIIKFNGEKQNYFPV